MLRPLVESKPLPPREAMAFWGGKVPVSKREWDALSRDAKSRAFVVAGLARGDMLDAVRESLAGALAQGQTFAEWKKAAAIQGLAGMGWTPARLDNIFRTNLQSAYQAGRYAQMRRVTADRPYWRYTAVNDSRTRPTHRALHGMIYSADDPFWDTYYPPNGYRCRCSVQSLSESQVAARGYEIQTKIPDTASFRDAKGNTVSVPLAPDTGFAGNVGKDWFAGLTPSPLGDDDIKVLSTRAVCRDGGGPAFAASGDACRPALATLDKRHVLPVVEGDLLPAKGKPVDYVRTFLREFGIDDLEGSKVITLPGVNLPVVISKFFFIEKATGDWKTTWQDKGPYVRLLARTIMSPYEIWQDTVEIAGKLRQSLRLIRLFRAPDSPKEVGGYCAFHLVQARSWAAATAFAPKAGRSRKAILEYLEMYRTGTLIYREP